MAKKTTWKRVLNSEELYKLLALVMQGKHKLRELSEATGRNPSNVQKDLQCLAERHIDLIRIKQQKDEELWVPRGKVDQYYFNKYTFEMVAFMHFGGPPALKEQFFAAGLTKKQWAKHEKEYSKLVDNSLNLEQFIKNRDAFFYHVVAKDLPPKNRAFYESSIAERWVPKYPKF